MKAKLVLTGALKGKTKKLNGIQFINGEFPLKIPIESQEGIIIYMKRCYEAQLIIEGDDHGKCDVQTDAQPGQSAEVSGHVRQDGEEPATETAVDGGKHDGAAGGTEGVLADGDGYQDPRLHSQIRKAVNLLDSANDSHWTKDGRPACDAVASVMGSGNVTRAQIEAAVPGFTRPE